MWNGPTYDCQQCGACCINDDTSGGAAYVYLRRDEVRKMHRLGLSVVHDAGDAHLGSRAHVGAGGRAACVAFTGCVGGTCGCAIYGDRPGNCRRFEVGGKLCRAMRREAGLSV